MSERFTEIATQALDAYGLGGMPYTFLQHSENVTFRVDAPTGTRLLRIHAPISALMGNHGANVAMIESEMLWLEALWHKTDLMVQQPVRNRDDQFVTQIGQGKRTFNCTLLEWLEGEPYRWELENEENAARLGDVVGKLHHFSSRWPRPVGFTRPKRDGAFFKKMMSAIKPTAEDGRASYRDLKSLEDAVETLAQIMRPIRKKERVDEILHGDLHKGNFLYNKGQIGLIDFSMAALGSHLFDLGVCLSDMRPALHSVFLEAYQTRMPLPPGHGRLIEGFFVGAMVMTFAFCLRLPEAQEQLVHKIPLIAQEYAAKFNRDERFWFK